MAVVQYAHVDYTRDLFQRWQWTFHQSAAGVLVQLLGILITIALAQLWILLQSLWFVKDQARHRTRDGAGITASPKRQPRSLWEVIIELLRDALHELSPPVQLPGAPPPARWKALLSKICLAFFAFVLFAGILALGTISNNLQGNSKVLTTSAACGAYVQESSNDYALRAIFETKAQRDAQQYARLCYGGRKLDYGCDQFSHQAISYQTIADDDCPWGGGMCHLGAKGAITFKTGPTPAFALGINAKPALQFERSTTCAPVNMNATFITHQKTSDNGCAADTFSYHYGWSTLIGKDDISWRSTTYESTLGTLSSYSVNAVAQEFGWDDKSTAPLIAMPYMTPPYGTTLTMIYIQPGRIYYMAPSHDPIFPAPHRSSVAGIEAWVYTDGHARVLACVDRARWRDLDEGQEWHERKEIPTEPPDRVKGDKWLLFLALQPSNIYQTISHAEALNTSSLLYTYTSSPLYPKQWEVEARQFFETSLARAQFETSYMAQGTYAAFPGWVMTSPNIISPKICHHIYLSNDPNFSNINGVIYLMVLVPCILVIVLSCPLDEKLLWEWLLGPDRAGRWAESAVMSSQALGKAMQILAVRSWKGLTWLLSKLWTISGRVFASTWAWVRRK